MKEVCAREPAPAFQAYLCIAGILRGIEKRLATGTTH
jgi:hypothetical protein